MTKLILALASCGIVVSTFAQSVGNPVYEPFSDSSSSGGTSYTPGDFLAGQSQTLPVGFQEDVGGHDAVQSWWEYGTSIYSNGVVATHQPIMVAGDLSYFGLASAGGGRSAQFGGNGDHAMMNLPIGSSGFLLVNTIYASFVLRLTDITALDTDGVFFAGFTQLQSYDHPYGTPTAVGGRIWVRSDGSGGFNVGIQKGGKGPTYGPVVWNSASYTTADTLFLVSSYTLQGTAGNSGGIDDVAQLWINPDYSTFGAALAPAADLTATETGGDSEDLDLQRIASFMLLDNADNEPTGQIDDLRIGLAWADVTSAEANPVQLVSATVVEGPYTTTAGQSVDAGNNTITVPMSGGAQFFRIRSTTPQRWITSLRISGGNVVMTYDDAALRAPAAH